VYYLLHHRPRAKLLSIQNQKNEHCLSVRSILGE
jgi:hypothetical protein